MNSLKQFLLLEKAKTETKSPYELLLPYKDREDIFITFTEINKVGINPRSTYDTPNGIYTYPLKEVWEEYGFDTDKKIASNIVFGGEKEYIQVLQLVDDKNVITNLKKYDDDDLNDDFLKLREIYVDENFLKGSEYKKFLELVSDLLGDEDIVQFNNIFDFMEYCDENDCLYVFESMLRYHRPNYKDKRWEIVDSIVEKHINTFDFTYIDYKSIEDVHINIPIGILWYITYKLSSKKYIIRNEMFRNDIFGNYTSGQRWNNMFRFLGYEGVVDREGLGLIHENEPIQAVFFSIKPIKHIDTIINSDIKSKKLDFNNDVNIYEIYNLYKNGDKDVDENYFIVNKAIEKINFGNKKQVQIFKELVDNYLYKHSDKYYDIANYACLINDDKFLKRVIVDYGFYSNTEYVITYLIKKQKIKLLEYIFNKYWNNIMKKDINKYISIAKKINKKRVIKFLYKIVNKK